MATRTCLAVSWSEEVNYVLPFDYETTLWNIVIMHVILSFMNKMKQVSQSYEEYIRGLLYLTCP